MDISLRETLELEKFKGFQLVAGKNGLARKVTKIGLLDYEMLSPIKGQFVEGEFALSTLLAAKDSPELIYSSVAYLIESGSSGLGVKDIYYQNLPEAVIKLANQHDFPIFMFDNSVYFEDIITEFKEFVDAIKSEASLSAIVKDLLRTSRTEEEVLRAFRRLIGHYQGNYRCFYVYLHEEKLTETTLVMKGHRLSKRLPILAAIPYKKGLFIVDKESQWPEIERMLREESTITSFDFNAGVGAFVTGEACFREELIKVLSLSHIARLEGRAFCEEVHMGVYELVMAGKAVPGIQTYMHKIIEPIKAYDGSNNSALFETAEAFVRSEGQIKATAKMMNQHDNTIRYRLSKIRQVIGVVGSDILLYERLSLAVRSYWLDQLKD